jgi:hypothetical protein
MVQEWWDAIPDDTNFTKALQLFANCVAQWGADQELEAIEHWLITGPYGASIACAAQNLIADLRAARRPKPPSLKEEALKARRNVWRSSGDSASWEILDRAIEALPDE